MPQRPRTREDVPVVVPRQLTGPLPIRCTTSRPRPDVCVVHLTGELDMATVPLVAGHLRRQTASPPADLLLDLAGVTHLAAAGLALIVACRDGDADVHGRLHLVGVLGNRPVERALRVTGLLPVLDVHDDVQALLDTLG
jgi:anti-sigma B factor antagonist